MFFDIIHLLSSMKVCLCVCLSSTRLRMYQSRLIPGYVAGEQAKAIDVIAWTLHPPFPQSQALKTRVPKRKSGVASSVWVKKWREQEKRHRWVSTTTTTRASTVRSRLESAPCHIFTSSTERVGKDPQCCSIVFRTLEDSFRSYSSCARRR